MLVGKRFSVNRFDDTYPWLIVDEDEVYIYAVYLPSKSPRVYKQIKSVLDKYPLNFMFDAQLTLF